MRIGINAQLLAFSADYRQAGLSRYIHELLLHVPWAIPAGRFVAFTTSHQPGSEFNSALAPNLKLVPSHLPTASPPVRIAWEQTVLPLAARRRRLDLLHCPVNVRPFLPAGPVVITIHDLIFLLYPGSFHPAKRLYLRIMTGWSARHSAHVIAVSEATRQDVIRLLRVHPSKVTTVYNGVGAQFTPLSAEKCDRFRQEKAIEGRVVLYVGTLEPRKNLTGLIKAFEPLTREGALGDVQLVIGGSKGWYYKEIFSAAQALGLVASGRVRFLGRVPDEELPLWYNIASVFAYPSRYEGFGLPALEAMACGTPVIVSNASSLPEVVGDAGILIDPDKTAAWADALRHVLTDQGLAREMSTKGVRKAGCFSWEQTASKTADVYRKVLGAGK